VGRPSIRKKGPMTAAERQRRHRRKLRAELRAAEIEPKPPPNPLAPYSAPPWPYERTTAGRLDALNATMDRVLAETEPAIREAALKPSPNPR
jgi:hypothetical protein